MDKIEIILIVAIICVILIDFFIKKKREKINLNLIGDEKIKFSGQSKFYYFGKYFKNYRYKLILALFSISLILLNPTKQKFIDYVPTTESYDNKYFLKYNFFVFSIYQENIYYRSNEFIPNSFSRSKSGTVTQKKYIGILNSFILISEEEKRFNF